MSAESPGSKAKTNEPFKPDSIDLDNVFAKPTREEWLTSALAGLPNHESLDSLTKQTLDGLTIQVLYDSCRDGQLDSMHSAAIAGAWDNRLCVYNYGDDASANKKILEGLHGGNSSLQIHVDGSNDLHTILKGVKLDLVTVSLLAGNAYSQTADTYYELAKTQSVDNQSIRCSFNADPIGTWLRGDSTTQPTQVALKELAAFSLKISQQLPLANTVLVDASIHHNAGASAKQELVASIATAALYLEALLDEGLTLQQANQQIVFQLACDADILMGVIKIRSLKCLWRHLLSEFAAARNSDFDPDSSTINIVVETSKRFLSTQDHWNNHLRNIAAVTAAAMASATTIMVHPHDKVQDWQATDDSSLGERIARNLPIILDRECGLTKVSDPTAGSFAIETLTQDLVDITWQSLSEINTGNAWITLLASGQWQDMLGATHTLRAQRLNDEVSVMIGVNRFKEHSLGSGISGGLKSSGANTKALLRAVRDAEEFDKASMAATKAGANS